MACSGKKSNIPFRTCRSRGISYAFGGKKKFTMSYNYLTTTWKKSDNFIQSFEYVTFPFRGIEPSSSTVDIKKAYRKAALRHHPDKVMY
jgi:DnaJ-class molecular chaperone